MQTKCKHKHIVIILKYIKYHCTTNNLHPENSNIDCSEIAKPSNRLFNSSLMSQAAIINMLHIEGVIYSTSEKLMYATVRRTCVHNAALILV